MDTESNVACAASEKAAAPPSMPKGPGETHLGVLDGMRGLMSLWVLGGHAAACSGASIPLLDHPGVAVDIFMFVSGLLMAFHFRLRESAEPWHSPTTWQKFYLRRFFRIAPAYYLLLTVAFLFRTQLYTAFSSILSTYRPDGFPASIVAPPLTWADALSHYTFIFGLIPEYAANTCLPDWSISLEMQFYLAFPFIMLTYRRLSYLRATLLFLALWAVAKMLIGVSDGSPPKLLGTFLQPSVLPLKLNCFLAGILVAEALHFRSSDLRKTTILLLGAFAVTLKGTSLYFQVACLISCMLLLGAGPVLPCWKVLGILDRISWKRIVSFFADTSYGVYLVHLLILLPMADFLLQQPTYAHLPASARFSVLMLGVSLLCYPLAFLLFRFVETPGIAFGRQLIRRFPQQTASRESNASISTATSSSVGSLP